MDDFICAMGITNWNNEGLNIKLLVNRYWHLRKINKQYDRLIQGGDGWEGYVRWTDEEIRLKCHLAFLTSSDGKVESGPI